MEELVPYFLKRLSATSLEFKRYLYGEIDWNARLTGIVGARGVGKTTLMLQYIRENYTKNEMLYVSADSFYFQKSSLFDLAEEFYVKGGRHLFVDEVHRYPSWAVEIKNLYDTYHDLKIVFSGSSALQIFKAEADLSRRALIYKLHNLSFREYIALETGTELPAFSLEEILNNHAEIAADIIKKIKPVLLFLDYLQGGIYPFFKDSKSGYPDRLLSTVQVIMEMDLVAIENLTYSTIIKLRRILAFIAESLPYIPNISELSRKSGVSRDVLLRLIDLLARADLLLLLRESSAPTGYLTKPDKIYLHNTALLYAISPMQRPETGTVRETFFANQLTRKHFVNTAPQGDFVVNDRYLFEIGGRNKKGGQIQHLKNSFIVRDNMETGYENFIPLWLFGMLY